eukprot:TRINITY_DN3397_c0_g1_i2.p1 TRINITY_DN3397_c0_g1~~TRINITY_DN3397_c0_g1_i2.p1  ORF type:complete len:377 (-),score=112.65 TRINITY_DN3397_c0_g1_i2:55-1185(-)
MKRCRDSSKQRCEEMFALSELLNDPEIDVNQLDEESMSALHWASAYGESKMIQLLLDNPKINPLIQNKRGGTPLHQATISGALGSVKTLLMDKRIKDAIDLGNMWGETALILASTRGDDQMAFVLLENGADRNVKDNWGKTAEEVANDHGENKTSVLIKQFEIGKTKAPIQKETISQPNVNQPKRILSKLLEVPLNEEQAQKWIEDVNMDVNAPDYMKWSAIHKLSAWEKPDLLKTLLSRADINANIIGLDGDTALHTALSSGAVSCAEVLIEDGRIDIDTANQYGITPLMLAASLGSERLVNLLLPLSSPKKVNREGKTAWHFAKESGFEPIAQLLPAGEVIEKKQTQAVGRSVNKLNPKLLQVQEAVRGKKDEE